MRALWDRFRNLVVTLEELPLGPAALAGALAAIVTFRNLLEIVGAKNPVFSPVAAFVHYPMAYVAPFLALALVLALWSRVPVVRVVRLMLLAWTITLLPPLVDFVLHRAKEAPTIGYLDLDPADLGFVFARFFDPRVSFTGTTAGIRVEIAAAVALGGLYVLLRGRSWLRAIGAAACLYPASLFFLTLPVLVLRVVRIVRPEATRAELLWGEALFNRGDQATAPDSIALLWLVPVALACGGLWLLIERARREDGWLHGRAGTMTEPGLPAQFACTVLAGGTAAVGLHMRSAGPTMLAPFDVLAACGAVLAVLLGGHAILRRGASSFVRATLGGLAVALLIALGPNAALPLAAAVAPFFVVDAGWLPSWSRPWVRAALCGAASLSSFAAGYALVLGAPALARVPAGLLMLALLAGLASSAPPGPRLSWLRPLLMGLALGAGGFLIAPGLGVIGLMIGAGAALVGGWLAALGPRAAFASPLLAGLALLAVARAGVASEATYERLSREALCVPRLAVIEAQKRETAKDWATAKTFYFEALKCDEDYVPALRGLGLGLLQNEAQEKMPRVLELLEKVATLAPASSPDLNNLASAYIRAQRAADALPLLDRAVALDPRNADALFNRALAVEDLGQRAGAIDAWRAFLARAERLPEAFPDVRVARQHLRALQAAAPGAQ